MLKKPAIWQVSEWVVVAEALPARWVGGSNHAEAGGSRTLPCVALCHAHTPLWREGGSAIAAII